MGLSDSPCPFIIGVRPWTSQCGQRHHPPWADPGYPGSRARRFRACPGSPTARGPVPSHDGSGLPIDGTGVAFRVPRLRRHPEVICFRGSIPGPHVPLSTLRRHPHGCLRMTRGRCGSLLLHRMALSSTTSRRFIPAHRGSERGHRFSPFVIVVVIVQAKTITTTITSAVNRCHRKTPSV